MESKQTESYTQSVWNPKLGFNKEGQIIFYADPKTQPYLAAVYQEGIYFDWSEIDFKIWKRQADEKFLNQMKEKPKIVNQLYGNDYVNAKKLDRKHRRVLKFLASSVVEHKKKLEKIWVRKTVQYKQLLEELIPPPLTYPKQELPPSNEMKPLKGFFEEEKFELHSVDHTNRRRAKHSHKKEKKHGLKSKQVGEYVKTQLKFSDHFICDPEDPYQESLYDSYGWGSDSDDDYFDFLAIDNEYHMYDNYNFRY